MPVGGVTIVAIWEPLFSECETILGSLELSGGDNVFIQAGACYHDCQEEAAP